MLNCSAHPVHTLNGSRKQEVVLTILPLKHFLLYLVPLFRNEKQFWKSNLFFQII